jgi:hypothetical protein
MARIFYFQATGIIYGVHHGTHEDDPKIRLPKGVAWIDVPQPPDQIRWPSPDEARPGREQWSRVNPITKAVELRKDIKISVDADTDPTKSIQGVVFEEIAELWKRYLAVHAPSWNPDDLRHGSWAEVRERLVQLDLILAHLKRALASVTPDPGKMQHDIAWVQEALLRLEAGDMSQEEFAAGFRSIPAPRDPVRAWDQAWREVRLFTETFYFSAWRLVDVLTKRRTLAFPGFSKLDARGVRLVRNHLLQHPEQHGAIFQQHLTITDAGPVLKGVAVVVRVATGRTEPDAASVDRGLFVNAKELHDELMGCLPAILS